MEKVDKIILVKSCIDEDKYYVQIYVSGYYMVTCFLSNDANVPRLLEEYSSVYSDKLLKYNMDNRDNSFKFEDAKLFIKDYFIRNWLFKKCR